MTSTINQYDALYTNLKNQFTVIYKGTECTVGDFMLMKANKKSESTNLPIATTHRNTSIATFVEYVNDKLTVKKAPVKDKTIKSFPFRTSISALLTATAACALILSCGIFSLSGPKNLTTTPYVAENNTSYQENFHAEELEEEVEYTTVNEEK